MNKKLLTFLFALTVSTLIFGQETISKPLLKNLIDSLFAVDQQVQMDFIEVLQKSAPSDTINFYNERKKETYKRHIPILKSIFSKNGYPTFEKVGKETSSFFFTLIQHSDIDVNFQSKMLKSIKKQVANNQVKGSDYAFLYDRVQRNFKKPQLYGTQLTYDNDGNAIPLELKDKETVNIRRAELGMETLEEYLKKATEVHKQQNKK